MTYSSLVFNGVDMADYHLQVRSYTLPDGQKNVETVQLADRAYPVGSKRAGGTIIIDCVIDAADNATLLGYLDNIWTALDLDQDAVLTIDTIDGRYWMCRSISHPMSAKQATSWEGQIEFLAADPLAYKSTADSNNHTIATDPDDLAETVGGTAPVRPVITITSDADHGETTVEIESVTTGEVFQWTGTFDTDDVLVIDCEARHVTLNDSASMTGQDRDFPQLLAGSNTWETSGFTGNLNLTYRDRYL